MRYLTTRRGARRRGFTLIEAAMATVIIGTGFIALLALIAAGTDTNRSATGTTTAINLANNIFEASLRVHYDDVYDLQRTHNPPVDGRLVALGNMPGWVQEVDVEYVDDNLLKNGVGDTQVEPTARITVVIRKNGEEVYRTSWLAARSS